MRAPETRRIVEKLAASIVSSPSANRHRTEFAANATSANAVYASVRSELIGTPALAVRVAPGLASQPDFSVLTGLSDSHFHFEYALGSDGVTRTPIISDAVAAGANR